MRNGAPADAPSLEELLRLAPDEAVELFRTLEPPAASDIPAEYSGHIPLAMRDDWEALFAGSGLGAWLGKEYRLEGGSRTSGQGSNLYRNGGGIERTLPFAWNLGPSTVDRRPALMMFYGAFRSWAGKRDLIDELRLVSPGLLLGLYHTSAPVENFTPRAAGDRSAVEFFVLSKATSTRFLGEAGEGA